MNQFKSFKGIFSKLKLQRELAVLESVEATLKDEFTFTSTNELVSVFELADYNFLSVSDPVFVQEWKTFYGNLFEPEIIWTKREIFRLRKRARKKISKRIKLVKTQIFKTIIYNYVLNQRSIFLKKYHCLFKSLDDEENSNYLFVQYKSTINNFTSTLKANERKKISSTNRCHISFEKCSAF